MKVVPEPPTTSTVPVQFPPTTSHLSIAVSLPTSAITAQLEKVIPKTFPFEVNKGAHAYGSPSRGSIKVENDVSAKRVSVSAPISGQVQVKKKVLLLNVSVGIDIAGGISASLSPLVATNWTINPKLSLSAHIDRAAVKTPVGRLNITGHARNAVKKAVGRVKGAAETRLANTLNVRTKMERIWNKMNSVHKLSGTPPTWMRITPKKATFGQFGYTHDSIESGLDLALETHVFIQETAPDVLQAPLPDLALTGTLSDECEFAIPVEVSYAVINKQLKSALSKGRIKLPKIDERVAITGATIGPHGDGILLTIDFNGKKGLAKSVSGRLYIVGVPVFDAATAELRVDGLKYTAATKSLLLKSIEWLARSKLLDAMQAAAVVNLSGALRQATVKANNRLEKLKKQLPKEVGAKISVEAVGIDRIVFAQEMAFAIVKVKGTLSAQLRQ